MSFQATVLRYCDMSWSALTELKAWLRLSKSFNTLDVACFNSPSLKVATATSAEDRALAYCPVETAFIISGYAISPEATPSEAEQVGNDIEDALEREAQRTGMSKLLLMVPADHPRLKDLDGWSDSKEVRVFERRIPPSVAMGGDVSYTWLQAIRHLN